MVLVLTRRYTETRPDKSKVQSLATTDVPMDEKVNSRGGVPVTVCKEWRKHVVKLVEFVAKFNTGWPLKKLIAKGRKTAPILPHFKNAMKHAKELKQSLHKVRAWS